MSGSESLRTKLLVPMLAAAAAVACLVAVISFWLGHRWAMGDLQRRFQSTKETLSKAAYPLTQPVIESVSALVGGEIITVTESGQVLASTASQWEPRQPHPNRDAKNESDADDAETPPDRSQGRVVYRFVRRNPRDEGPLTIFVGFDELELKRLRRNAAMLPLVTGLSTVALLSLLTYLTTQRLVKRISRLQDNVEQIAEGDFDCHVADDSSDELGKLGQAVHSMSSQLKQLWQAVNQQQGEKLLHQMAAGMAHQLRNSLTGARLAVQLHEGRCEAGDEGLAIALRELEHLDSHVRRLVMVGAGAKEEDRPEQVVHCLRDVQMSLKPMAEHLGKQVLWGWEALDDALTVRDGPTFTSAISNLALNAMQAGDEVEVTASLNSDASLVSVSVRDNGQGIPDDLASEIFSPFVTSKQEGLGLGLPLVSRSAEYLGGAVQWCREAEQTVFTFTAAIHSNAQSDATA